MMLKSVADLEAEFAREQELVSCSLSLRVCSVCGCGCVCVCVCVCCVHVSFRVYVCGVCVVLCGSMRVYLSSRSLINSGRGRPNCCVAHGHR